jgi:hypothetical protein
MLITHKLRKGETFATVMKKYAVKDWKATWDLAQNKALKAKRKTADRVEPGDTLMVIDPSARFYEITFAKQTFMVPEAEMADVRKAISAAFKKKALPRLIKLKAAYDADYEYMADLAVGSGMLTGFLVQLLEDRSGARLPTKEMNAVATAIKDATRATNAADFAGQVDAMRALESAMADYVAAAEKYRSKMIGAAEVGVVAATITREGAFLLLSALASGGAGTVCRVMTSLEIGVAMGAASSLIKAGSDEIGQFMAGEERSASEVTYSMVREFFVGGASGLASGFLRNTKIAQGIQSKLAATVMKAMPRYFKQMARNGRLMKFDLKSKAWERMDAEDRADFLIRVFNRMGVSGAIKGILAWTKTREGIDLQVAAIGDAVSGLTGKESLREVGEKIGAAILTDDVIDSIMASILAANRDDIERLLDKEPEKKAA